MKSFFDSVLNGAPSDIELEDVIVLWESLKPCPKPEKDPNTGQTISSQLVAFVALRAAQELMVRQKKSDGGAIQTWEIDLESEAAYSSIQAQCAKACKPAPAPAVSDEEKLTVWDLGR